jgi:hypothetical protein
MKKMKTQFENQQVTRRTLSRDVVRATKFLSTVSRTPEVRRILARAAGYTEAHHQAGWEKLHRVMGYQAGDGGAELRVRGAERGWPAARLVQDVRNQSSLLDTNAMRSSESPRSLMNRVLLRPGGCRRVRRRGQGTPLPVACLSSATVPGEGVHREA